MRSLLGEWKRCAACGFAPAGDSGTRCEECAEEESLLHDGKRRCKFCRDVWTIAVGDTARECPHCRAITYSVLGYLRETERFRRFNDMYPTAMEEWRQESEV